MAAWGKKNSAGNGQLLSSSKKVPKRVSVGWRFECCFPAQVLFLEFLPNVAGLWHRTEGAPWELHAGPRPSPGLHSHRKGHPEEKWLVLLSGDSPGPLWEVAGEAEGLSGQAKVTRVGKMRRRGPRKPVPLQFPVKSLVFFDGNLLSYLLNPRSFSEGQKVSLCRAGISFLSQGKGTRH